MSFSGSTGLSKDRQLEADELLAEILRSMEKPAESASPSFNREVLPQDESNPASAVALSSSNDSFVSELTSLSQLLTEMAGKLKDHSKQVIQSSCVREVVVTESPKIPQTLETALHSVLCLGGTKPTSVVLAEGKVGFVFEWGKETVEGLKRFLEAQTDHRVLPGPEPVEEPLQPQRRVLVVEDDAVTRVLLRNVLKRLPQVDLVETCNGREGWEALDGGFLPDLCIMDVMMPEMSGIQLVEKMRADVRFKCVEVIFCSSLCDRDTVLKAGMMHVDYLLKPFAADKLLERVDKALKRAAEMWEAGFVEARRRLGLDADSYSYLIEQLIEEITLLVGSIRSDLSVGDYSAASTKIGGLRGASLNIGDQTLAELTSLAESAINRGYMESSMTALDQVQSETFRLKNMLAWLPRTKPRTQPDHSPEATLRDLVQAAA